MKHIMKINEKAFERIKEGSKIREYRINDEKRKNICIGDTIEFQKLPDLKEKIEVDVINIENYKTLKEAIEKHFESDFANRHSNIEETVASFYKRGFCTKEEERKYGCAVFEIKKQRVIHYNSAACYLKKDGRVLMLKYTKKWEQIYTPPGGKFEREESPIECITREFFEETGLTLIEPKLQGLSYYSGKTEGVIFIFVAEEYEGVLTPSKEGSLHWINIEDLPKLKQFGQNEKFTPYLFKREIFEGKFLVDDTYLNVLDYEIKLC